MDGILQIWSGWLGLIYKSIDISSRYDMGIVRIRPYEHLITINVDVVGIDRGVSRMHGIEDAHSFALQSEHR